MYCVPSTDDLQRADVTAADRSETANRLASSGSVFAFTALAYSPASIAVGIFGMRLEFVGRATGDGYWQFFAVLACLYTPVVLFFVIKKMLKRRQSASDRRQAAKIMDTSAINMEGLVAKA